MSEEEMFVRMMLRVGQEVQRHGPAFSGDLETGYTVLGNYAWASFWFKGGQLVDVEVSE